MAKVCQCSRKRHVRVGATPRLESELPKRRGETKGIAVRRSDPVLERLRRALTELDATRSGFEGIVAALVEAGSGGRVRLMSSGDQQGVDAIEEPGGTGPRRAVQAKKYAQGTSLDLNGLRGEMSRAARHFAGLDCWILATTQALHGKEADDLRAEATTLGIKFIPLDWSGAENGIPPLAALCAAYPELLLPHPGLGSLGADVAVIAARTDFPRARDAVLAELRSADASFAGLREAGSLRLEALFRDPPLARRLAGPSPALLASAPPVTRTAPLQAIADWRAGSARALAVLGGEGQGKTWVALEAARAATQSEEAPLVLTVPANAAARAAEAWEAVVAALSDLGDHAGVRVRSPADFWRARVARWAEPGEGGRPVILLIVDGLDELDPFDWDSWLAPLLEQRRQDLFRVLLTCRDDDWARRVKLRDLSAQDLALLPLGRFEPGERDYYLRQRQIDPDLLSPEVLNAALHPRTAFHLSRLAGELPDLRRVTREQLLLRDFRNRGEIKGGAFRPENFERLVRNLAVEVQRSALRQAAYSTTEGELVASAAALSGYDAPKMRSVVSDLVTSDWFSRDPDDDTRIEFADERLPDAIGMALAAEVRGLGAAEALAEVDRFLEPWGADDIVERVLRTCATVLIIDEAVPDVLCTALLERWYGRPFHGNAGQDFWRRLHVFRPALFLDFAETRLRYGHEFLLEWGLASLWDDHPEARALIEPRLRAWLTQLSLPEEVIDVDERFARHPNADRNRQLARCAALTRRGSGSWRERLGRERNPEAPGLMVFAVRTIGFLARTPFVPLIGEWAMTVAAAGRPVAAEEMGALVRENGEDHDQAVAAIRSEAARLAGRRQPPARRAASYLFQLTGLPEDAAQASALFRRLVPQVRQVAVLRDGDEIDLAEQNSFHPRFLLGALASHAADSSVGLTARLQEALRTAIAATEIVDVPGWFAEWKVLAAITRWAPDEARQLVTRYLAAPPLEETARAARAEYRRVAIGAMPILDEEQLCGVADALDAMVEAEGQGRAEALTYHLSPMSWNEQVELLLDHDPKDWPTDFGRELRSPSRIEVEALLGGIGGEGEAGLRRRLLLAGVAVRLARMKGSVLPIDWDRLFVPGAEAFRAAVGLALDLEDVEAARSLAVTGWDSDEADDESLSFETSELLALLPDDELRPVIPRLQPETLVRLYGRRPALRPDTGPPLLDWVRGLLLTRRTQWGLGGSYYTYDDRQACFDALFEGERGAIEAMLREAWSDKGLRRNIEADHGSGPVWPLLRVFWSHDPEFVEEVWRGVTDRSASFWVGEVETFPAKLPVSPAADALRVRVLERSTTDDKLFGVVNLLQRSGHEAWLLAEVGRLAASGKAVDRARAYAIAGFMDASRPVRDLWSGDFGAVVPGGWLGGIHAAALAWHREAAWAQHWWRQIVEARSEYEAWGAHARLVQVYDDRFAHHWEEAPRVDRHGERAQWLDRLIAVKRATRKRRKDGLKNLSSLAPRTDRIIYRE